MGRPKLDDARDRSYKVRVNEEEERMLQFIVDHTGQKKADIFRRSLKELYNSVKMHNYETKNGPDDLYEGLDGIDLKRIVACPHCGSDNKIDLTDECTSTSHERSMGDEILYEFDRGICILSFARCFIEHSHLYIANYYTCLPTNLKSLMI